MIQALASDAAFFKRVGVVRKIQPEKHYEKMKKSDRALVALAMMFCTALVLSNVVAAKVVVMPLPGTGGAALRFPGAVFCYAITFLATDVIGEIWGRREAALVVRFGFCAQVAASLLLMFVQALPAADPAVQDAYARLLGQNAVFAAASLAAYALSQSWDVFAFHGIRDRVLARHPGAYGRRWIWNNLSTMSSQFIDTAVFIGLAFGVGLGWLSDADGRARLLSLALGQYAVKIALAAVDTIPFYALTRRGRPPGTARASA